MFLHPILIRNKMMFYIILIFFLTDQISKYFTVKFLDTYESVSVINNVLDFTHVHNTGGPWSIFDGNILFFIVVTIIIFVLGIWYFSKNKPTHILEKLSICMIAGGALGNFADRIIRGYVVDMIDVNFFNYPVFNVADCYIVVGAILYAIYVVFVIREND